ncbi:MAG: MBL fold metallo-hydrolase [Candidatus Hydrogenedentes bacterium]|nr:MBL fold metallo-hydrolase [Candidatus Hydrogenedentota bacterium]
MIFHHFRLDVEEVNAYIVACSEKKEALLVDAGEWMPEMERFLCDGDLRLAHVFITHDHYDHSGALGEIAQKYHPKVYAGKDKVGGVAAQRLGHGDTVRVGTLSGTALATPGHTPEGISLAIPGHVFTGDALFAGSVGGTGSPALYQQQIDHIRRHIFALPPDTEIHPGHGPASTVRIESGFNPFFV